MKRDELLAWLLLPWNIVKAIAVTVWWIVSALIHSPDDDEPEAVPNLPVPQPARRPDRATEPGVSQTVSVDPRP